MEFPTQFTVGVLLAILGGLLFLAKMRWLIKKQKYKSWIEWAVIGASVLIGLGAVALNAVII